LSSRICIAIATFSNFYVSHGSATRFRRNGEKYYIYLVDNSFLFPTVEKFIIGKQYIDEVIAKSWAPHFCET